MVGAVGFEPTPLQPFQPFAGLGWQPKDRNGSQRNNCWTRIGHATENVWLTEAGDPDIVVNTAVSHTSGDGTFTLKGVAQTDYVVHADIYMKPHYTKFCSREVTIAADNELAIVKLVLDQTGAACGR